MIKTRIIISDFAYSELPEHHNENAMKIRDGWQYDARASMRTSDAR